MIMDNHGVLMVGKTTREAFVLMRYLIHAVEVQLKMEAACGELIEILPEAHGRSSYDWPAYLRMLDKIDRSYWN